MPFSLLPHLLQVSLYAYFRKPDGSPLIERNSNGRFRGNQPMSEHLFDERIIKKVVRSNWAVREGRIKKVCTAAGCAICDYWS